MEYEYVTSITYISIRISAGLESLLKEPDGLFPIFPPHSCLTLTHEPIHVILTSLYPKRREEDSKMRGWVRGWIPKGERHPKMMRRFRPDGFEGARFKGTDAFEGTGGLVRRRGRWVRRCRRMGSKVREDGFEVREDEFREARVEKVEASSRDGGERSSHRYRCHDPCPSILIITLMGCWLHG
jgi:hypothetical protein